MDNLVILQTTLLAIQETVAGNSSLVRPAIVGQVNSVLNEVAKIIPGAHFAKFDSYPDPQEVLPQIKLALKLLENRNPSPVTKGAAPDDSATTQLPSQPEGKERPQIFIGCSVEGLPEAQVIQLQLRHSATAIVWNQGVFGLTQGTLETLVDQLRRYTYAILVLTPDDMVIKREREENAARDNVLFELGLFMGALGREKTFIVAEKSVRLPSDLAGIKTATYQRGEGKNLQAELGPVVTQLQIAMGFFR